MHAHTSSLRSRRYLSIKKKNIYRQTLIYVFMMRLERKHLLAIFLLTSLTMTISGQIKAAEEELQNVKVNITKIDWHVFGVYTSLPNYTIFIIDIELQTRNQNNYDITLHMGCITSYYLINMTWSLDDTNLEVIHFYGREVQDMEWDFTIAQGLTNETAWTTIGISKLGLKTLPDGEYIFWIYLMQYGESILDSRRSKVIIENGIPTFQYEQTINLALQKTQLFLFLIFASFTIRYFSRRKDK